MSDINNGRGISSLLSRILMASVFSLTLPIPNGKASVVSKSESVSETRVTPCDRTYREFYKSDNLDFRVIFGYKDARPARLVTDRYERLVFIQRMVGLGFERDATDDEVLERRINGPDGKQKQIRLRVVASSVGADDELNRKNPFQRWQAMHAKENFLDGLKHANATIYVGHSRKGGGPDFSPPSCTSNGHVDYAKYLKNREGFKEMNRVLSSPVGSDANQTRLVGLLSCDSDKHFSQGSKKLSSRLGRLSNTSPLYYADSTDDLVYVVQGLTSFKCKKDLLPPDTALTGFFSESK